MNGGSVDGMKARLDALRAELARQGLDGFIVPHADEFQNEYLPPSAERLAWITGFTGSDSVNLNISNRDALPFLRQIHRRLYSPILPIALCLDAPQRFPSTLLSIVITGSVASVLPTPDSTVSSNIGTVNLCMLF